MTAHSDPNEGRAPAIARKWLWAIAVAALIEASGLAAVAWRLFH